MATCSVPNCAAPHRAKGFCKTHYYELRAERCDIEGCARARAAKGLCKMHWRRTRDPDRTCETCRASYVGDPRSRYCSQSCKSRGSRLPLRNALDDGDLPGILFAARSASVVTSQGCWEWQYAKNGAGYPMLGHGGSAGLVHRRLLAAVMGRSLGKEPVHHKCANRSCINPDHLQPVSQRENVAEMLSRHYFMARIADLEAALRELAPDHPLIQGASNVQHVKGATQRE